jgi:hypothetical protein
MFSEELVQALLMGVVDMDVLVCIKEVEFATREGLKVSLPVSKPLK